MLGNLSTHVVAILIAVIAAGTIATRAFLNPKTEAAPIAKIADAVRPVGTVTVPTQTTSGKIARGEPAQGQPHPLVSDDVRTGRQSAASADSESPVLKVANSYPNGGGFNWDSGTGTPDEIRFKGVRILSKAKSGTYCCGFTFAVAMKTAAESGLLREKSVRQIRRFQQHWYATTPEAKEKQQIFAIQLLGIGREVPLMKAEPGDFLRLWHGSSGHSVILIRWIVENGRKVGIEYRGTQSSTNGIGNHIEYIDGTPGHSGGFQAARTYAARLNASKNLQPIYYAAGSN